MRWRGRRYRGDSVSPRRSARAIRGLFLGALSAARLFTAFLHGFATMENGGEFKMGGSVDAAFGFGLEAILGGLA